MNPSDAPMSTRIKVGLFTVLGVLLIGAMTVYVNHKPQWWRPCQLVHINVDDGTGLKAKSPIRSLGIEIGYLKSVNLEETHVDLGICITAQVEVLPTTRAYLRGEGFLGDKFVELKPVKYIGPPPESSRDGDHSFREVQRLDQSASVSFMKRALSLSMRVLDVVMLTSSARAEDPQPAGVVDPAASPSPTPTATQKNNRGRQIPVGDQGQDMQKLVSRVDQLVHEMTNLTTNIKSALNPEDLRATMKQLNRTLENASRTLSPEGGLNQTAQRTLAKLEDAIEQLRDQLTRTNKGEGSVGMLLNDPSYAEEIREAVRNVNKLLSKVGGVRFVVDMGGEQIAAYNGGRGFFRLQIYPRPDRYYLLGISIDPRGKITQLNTFTRVGGQETTTSTRQVEPTGLLFTVMFGKVFFKRLDLSIGALHGDGAFSTELRLGPREREELLMVRGDIYFRGADIGMDGRVSVSLRPWAGSPHAWQALYLKAGVEGFRPVGGTGGITPYFWGAGVTFDDEDIKLLFALR